MTKFFKVQNQGDAQVFKKSDGSELTKCAVILQELGGKYANTYLATLLGDDAKQQFTGMLVAAELCFMTHEYEGKTYQDVVVREIVKINK